ncbi:hypothetical protein AK830_g3768 [Neonectria ditissima]|uniref:DUF7703 domain-containing protein n=1 Tax=Neonectria ditissima TaxID=78410 RepID=A0A0P7BQT7_9HYPO|nr:hypothetical protein AK830_g3768 [Neonectria ditissima]
MVNVNTKDGVVAVIIIVFISIAYYNVLELNAYIFGAFRKRSRLYFWSFLVATWGIAFNGTGYLIKHLSLSAESNLYATLILIGCANSNNLEPFLTPYSVFEKIQLSVFFVQELISGFYIWETTKRLKLETSVGNKKTRLVLNYLIYVNILVVLLDVSILALDVKLKLEFSILNRLVELTRAGRNDSSYTRSQGATHGDGVVLETFNGERRKHFMGTNGQLTTEYKVRVSKGENNHATHSHGDSSLVKTTEITVHSHRRPSHSDQDSESLGEIRSNAMGQVYDKPRGSASSTSSEVQFARFGN